MTTCICINREYGSNGSLIADKLSLRLHIPCFDKELIRLAVEESGIDSSLLNPSEPKKANEWLDEHFYEDTDLRFSGKAPNDILARAMVRGIEKLGRKEDCILMGRCADRVLRPLDGVTPIAVFITAPLYWRIRNVMERDGLTELEAMLRIRKIDKVRSEYFDYYTKDDPRVDRGGWGVPSTYDMCFNPALMPEPFILDMLAEAYRNAAARAVPRRSPAEGR